MIESNSVGVNRHLGHQDRAARLVLLLRSRDGGQLQRPRLTTPPSGPSSRPTATPARLSGVGTGRDGAAHKSRGFVQRSSVSPSRTTFNEPLSGLPGQLQVPELGKPGLGDKPDRQDKEVSVTRVATANGADVPGPLQLLR